MNKTAIGIISGTIGAIIGGAVTFFTTKSVIEKKVKAEADAEIDQIRTDYANAKLAIKEAKENEEKAKSDLQRIQKINSDKNKMKEFVTKYSTLTNEVDTHKTNYSKMTENKKDEVKIIETEKVEEIFTPAEEPEPSEGDIKFPNYEEIVANTEPYRISSEQTTDPTYDVCEFIYYNDGSYADEEGLEFNEIGRFLSEENMKDVAVSADDELWFCDDINKRYINVVISGEEHI